jgi:hypothetical protein
MAGSRREGAQDTIERGGPTGDVRYENTGDRRPEGDGSTAQGQAERLGELGRRGVERATGAAQGSSLALAGCAQEITAAWTHYAEEVMRHTSEASRALLRARTFNEMFEVQVKLLRETMQAFLDQSVRVAESASRIATRPLEELKAAGSDQPQR